MGPVHRASVLAWLAACLLAILAAGLVSYALLWIAVAMQAWGM